MKSVLKKKSVLSLLFVVPIVLSFFTLGIIYAATTVTTNLSQLIAEAALSIDIVDADGASVASPTVAFDTYYFSFEAGNSSGILGTSTQKIRISNPTETATWDVTFSATGGVSSTWSDGGTNTYPYNNAISADNGRLTVDPTTNGVITPASGCNATNINKGSQATFINGTTDSITILTATATAQTLCYWDFTAVDLTQRIPASQPTASYSIGMTLSVM